MGTAEAGRKGNDPKLNKFGCYGTSIRLKSGRYLDLLHPMAVDFTFNDIAHGLAMICRFGGQCDQFYSVAEHSVHCASQAAKDGASTIEQAAVLMHDAAEAFVGDMVRPLKVEDAVYRKAEERMLHCIEAKYCIEFAGAAKLIKQIDNEMLIAERLALFTADGVKWPGEDSVRKLEVVFPCWSPSRAKSKFIERAKALRIGVDE